MRRMKKAVVICLLLAVLAQVESFGQGRSFNSDGYKDDHNGVRAQGDDAADDDLAVEDGAADDDAADDDSADDDAADDDSVEDDQAADDDSADDDFSSASGELPVEPDTTLESDFDCEINNPCLKFGPFFERTFFPAKD
ncbi:hypothetical protein HELRODRAFT_182176 [Helobdella robusta]|uniref:Uncharacterized protein n=1 Tax=Helobdella robusta TaxID=6412 RepID=T1FHV6_HELRO|nr:hypothetical protein HELRODRAFT_182176 [Helobdella robusta]ESN91204.1 hypothetical protein HELRODRAFT_182176 [Helobdella robusta]